MPLRLNDFEYQLKDEGVAMTLLAASVHHWLSYVDKVSRTNLLLENSLKYAISEFVERKMHGTCLLEQKHPHFSSRPIDFIWPIDELSFQVDKDNCLKVECEDGTLHDAKERILENGYVLECKYASAATNGTHERQRIFNDLCRLYYVLEHYPKAHAMFMMAGEISDFEDYFQEAKPSRRKIKNDIVTAKEPIKIIDIDVPQNDFNIQSYKNFGDRVNKLSLKVQKSAQVKEYITISFKEWFGFDIENDSIRTIDTSEKSNKVFYEDFISEYASKNKKKSNYCADEIKIKTELIAKYPPHRESNTQMVAIWKISQIK